jgi:hypothetical protein
VTVVTKSGFLDFIGSGIANKKVVTLDAGFEPDPRELDGVRRRWQHRSSLNLRGCPGRGREAEVLHDRKTRPLALRMSYKVHGEDTIVQRHSLVC